jgi:hypothetical protein
MVAVTKLMCPTCGAPLRLSLGQRHVICVYCDMSLLVHETAPAAGASAPRVTLTPEPISKEDIARIKTLVLADQQEEAILLYGKTAGVSRADATKAVHQLMIPTLWKQMRRMPLNLFGFLLYLVLIGASGALAVWATVAGLESPGLFAVTALAAFACVRWVVSFLVKLVSTYVVYLGRPGRGRVLKRAIIDAPNDRWEGVTAIVLFEVTPADGSASFVDEEAFNVRKESVAKLAPGNVMPVRFDGARTRVFPIFPIQVLESQPQ